MNAKDGATANGPLDVAPQSTAEQARAAWAHALRGLPLGAYDEQIVAHAAQMFDQPTLAALASLLERARDAAVPQPGDGVERWLTGRLADFKGSIGASNAIRVLLTDHETHARFGVPLDQDIPLPPASTKRVGE